MFKKPALFLLPIASIILLIITFTYFVFFNSRQTNNSPYYKTSDVQYNDFTTITQANQWAQQDLRITAELLAKKKINGSFSAQTDNLGIIAIPFSTHSRSVNDKIIFRLKETGKSVWYFQSTYNADQFQNNIPFPFGFPIIKNSKDNSYIFEIESLAGKSGDSLSLSKKNYYFLAKYKFSKSDLVKNPSVLFQFLVAKTIEQAPLLKIGEIIFIIFSFLLSFIIYWVVMIFNSKNKIIFLQALRRTVHHANFNLFSFIQGNSITILIVLLILIIGTSTFYNYVKFPLISSTESRLDSFPTNDFYTVLYFKTEQLIRGQEMNQEVMYPGQVDASGQVLPLFFAPFLIFFKPDRYVSYLFFLGLVTLIFIVFYALLMRKSDKQILNAGLIFLIAFFLSEPGYIGIYMGNIDILLAPLTGLLMLTVLSFLKRRSISFIQTIGVGILAGSLVNIKITLLPFVLVAILFSKRIFLTLIITLAIFLAFIYIPNIFGSKSTLILLFSKIAVWGNTQSLLFHFWFNHSLYIVASFFTQCVELNNCHKQNANTLVALALFLLTFLTPFLLFRPIKKIIINKSTFVSLLNLKINKELALVLFVLSDAFINLSFKIVYDYRLFFSLIVTLILLKETAKVKSALVYCYLSMFSLLLGGMWVMQMVPNEPGTIDARLLKIFIIFHFFFLILSALTYWKESQRKPIARISTVKVKSAYRKNNY